MKKKRIICNFDPTFRGRYEVQKNKKYLTMPKLRPFEHKGDFPNFRDIQYIQATFT